MNVYKIQRFASDVTLHVILILVSLFMMLPFIWMVSTSFKPENEVYTTKPTLISPNASFYAYEQLIIKQNILNNLKNSVIVSTLYTLVSLFFCSLGGYGFAKYKFKIKKVQEKNSINS